MLKSILIMIVLSGVPDGMVEQLKKVAMCPSVYSCSDVVEMAIKKYPESARDIITSAIINVPICETEIVQGVIAMGIDPQTVLQATAAGRVSSSPFSPPVFGSDCYGCGGVVSPN